MAIIFIDLDGVVADFGRGINMYGDHHIEGFFSALKPIPGAVQSIKLLHRSGYNIYFLSKSTWSRPTAWAEKVLWVQKYFNEPEFEQRLIISANKGLLKGDVLIDDDIRNKEGFDGRFIHFGSKEYPNWPVVLRSLLITKI
jgi:5'(3')-deoxyribonucleotidase